MYEQLKIIWPSYKLIQIFSLECGCKLGSMIRNNALQEAMIIRIWKGSNLIILVKCITLVQGTK